MEKFTTLYTKQGRLLPCFCFDRLPSTNDMAKKLLKEGAGESFSVTAREQTSGRGRMSRSFFSPRDEGLYLSFCTEAKGDFLRFGALSALAVHALAEEYFKLDVRFKWPNDVVSEGKKLCGILPESVVSEEGKRYVVVGVGLNVFESAADFGALRDTATSARECCRNNDLICAFSQDKHGILLDMGVRLTELLARLAELTAGGEDLSEEYRSRLVTLGRKVRFSGEDGKPREGVAEDVTRDLALVVRTAEGTERVRWGEVVHLV